MNDKETVQPRIMAANLRKKFHKPLDYSANLKNEAVTYVRFSSAQERDDTVFGDRLVL